MGIALLFMLSQYFDLMIQAVDYSKYSGFSIRGLRHLMLSILHQIHIFVNSRYTSLSTPDSALPSQALIHPIVSEPSLQDVYPSSPIAIGLPIFGLCHLATTLAIQWGSWHLITREKSRLRSTSFSTSPPTVLLKSVKSHAWTSEQSADMLDNLSCIHISD